jgi:hypothetical protein
VDFDVAMGRALSFLAGVVRLICDLSRGFGTEG